MTIVLARTRLAMAVLLVPFCAYAQPAAHSFDELRARIRGGEQVAVVDRDGRAVRGTIAGVSSGSLQVTVDGQAREWAEGDVAAVRLVDPLKNGTIIGAVAGGTGGLFAGAAAAFAAGGLWEADEYDSYVVIGIVGGAVLGGLLGRTIDAHIPGRLLFEGPRATVHGAPPASAGGRRRAVMSIALRF